MDPIEYKLAIKAFFEKDKSTIWDDVVRTCLKAPPSNSDTRFIAITAVHRNVKTALLELAQLQNQTWHVTTIKATPYPSKLPKTKRNTITLNHKDDGLLQSWQKVKKELEVYYERKNVDLIVDLYYIFSRRKDGTVPVEPSTSKA